MTQQSVLSGGDSRLTGVLAALSLVSDIGRGRPADEAMRACLVATALARAMGLSTGETSAIYYTALLRSVGCTATSHEYAALYGDDVAVRGRGDLIDARAPRETFTFLWEASAARTDVAHVRAFAAAVGRGRHVASDGARSDCEVGARMARRFGLDTAVEQGILGVFERWDGRGVPGGLAGEKISLPARFAAVAHAFVLFSASFGLPAAWEHVRRWSGGSLDPGIVDALVRHGEDVVSVLGVDDAWVAVVDGEPGPFRRMSSEQLEEIARAFGDGADLKSPWLHGHSSGVADLAGAAAAALGSPPEEVARVRRAGLLHDIGRAGISTRIWDKPGPLTTAEWEQVRLHPYHTERILGRAPALAPLARLAGMHHERLDASGYFRAAPAAMQDLAMRVLAAADVYHALIEERPHRPALRPDEAARALEAEALDSEAVRAVIEAAGETGRRRPRPSLPASASASSTCYACSFGAARRRKSRGSCSSRLRPSTPTCPTSTRRRPFRLAPGSRCSPWSTTSSARANPSPRLRESSEQSIPPLTPRFHTPTIKVR